MHTVHFTDLEVSDTAERVEINSDPEESKLLMQFTTLSATDSGCSPCSQITRASYEPQCNPNIFTVLAFFSEMHICLNNKNVTEHVN